MEEVAAVVLEVPVVASLVGVLHEGEEACPPEEVEHQGVEPCAEEGEVASFQGEASYLHNINTVTSSA